MKPNPKIYEINTRLFLIKNNAAYLLDLPVSIWENLHQKGFNYIWLMGVWDTCASVIPKACFQDGLVHSYEKALKDFSPDDVIGSPYAINRYKPHKSIGTLNDLKTFNELLHTSGMGLILDFVPNHFSADSDLLKEHPEYFLEVSKEVYQAEPHTFFESFVAVGRYFAHGRDPFFPAWTDTVQVNFSNKELRQFYKKTMEALTDICDGVRCDMAMLALNNVFHNTWGMLLADQDETLPEIWSDLIESTKAKRNDFIFIAEAYWDLEWELQQLGFNFTYDKKLLDRLREGNADKVRDHLRAEEVYQKKSLRFIENHDEERAITAMGKEKSLAASVIISTIKGMRFFHDGQFQGKKVKLPVQLGREPIEKNNDSLEHFYNKLLSVTNEELFETGFWELLECNKAWENNYSNHNMLAWHWSLNLQRALVVVNFSGTSSQCRIKLGVTYYPEQFDLIDVLNNKTYKRNRDELLNAGLFIELGPFQSHIFRY